MAQNDSLRFGFLDAVCRSARARCPFLAMGAILLLASASAPICRADEKPTPLPPQRIVSLSLAGDQLLLQLVEPKRIAALTHLAADPEVSLYCKEARGIPTTHGLAEEVAILHPDLILAGAYNTRGTIALLKQIGVPILELGVPSDFDQLRAQIRKTAASLGAQERAEAIIAAMDARLEQMKPPGGPLPEKPSGLVYFQDGYVPGGHTFANAILEAAGIRNLGADFSAGYGAPGSLEAILMAHPQIVILTTFHEANPASTQGASAHSVFRELGPTTEVVTVPFRYLACPDPAAVELAERLHSLVQKRAGKNR